MVVRMEKRESLHSQARMESSIAGVVQPVRRVVCSKGGVTLSLQAVSVIMISSDSVAVSGQPRRATSDCYTWYRNEVRGLRFRGSA